jgi:MSHA biogenesis protein MshK
MARRLTFLLALLVAAPAAAAPFADPTRPPGAAEEVGAEGQPAGPRLESVLISPHRTLAVISGKEVRVGERFGEGRVVRITPTEVAIRRGGETEVLRLFPSYSKRPEGKTR